MSKANNLRNLRNLRTFLFLGSKTRFSEMAAAEGAQGAQVAHAFPRARAREGGLLASQALPWHFDHLLAIADALTGSALEKAPMQPESAAHAALRESLRQWRASRPRWPAAPRHVVIVEAALSHGRHVAKLKARYRPDQVRILEPALPSWVDQALARAGWGPLTGRECMLLGLRPAEAKR